MCVCVYMFKKNSLPQYSMQEAGAAVATNISKISVVLSHSSVFLTRDVCPGQQSPCPKFFALANGMCAVVLVGQNYSHSPPHHKRSRQ